MIKTVDSTIVRVEIIEYWQRLKVYRISLERYLNKRSMELFKHEVVFLTGIQLKVLFNWLMNKIHLREH